MEIIQKTLNLQAKKLTRKNSWWIPVWKGLVVDDEAKHRTAMGTSVWLFLYLLFSVNRKTGYTRKKQSEMAADLKYSVKTVQKQLANLKKHGYIEVEPRVKMPKIKISKWKLFNKPKSP
jgi:DNA-binding MarR family transcriptional regulator